MISRQQIPYFNFFIFIKSLEVILANNQYLVNKIQKIYFLAHFFTQYYIYKTLNGHYFQCFRLDQETVLTSHKN